jgi:hypothetical protein
MEFGEAQVKLERPLHVATVNFVQIM